MSLPDPCAKCVVDGGFWVMVGAGMARCECPRGQALALMAAQAAETPEPRQPVLTDKEAEICVEMLGGIVPFFPAADNPFSRGMVGAEIRDMCDSFDQARLFVRRFARLYRKWPGIAEMRWAFCQMGFKPLDAIQPAIDASEVYPEGIPPERPAKVAQIGSGREEYQRLKAETLRLPGAGAVSADAEMDSLVRSLAGRKAL